MFKKEYVGTTKMECIRFKNIMKKLWIKKRTVSGLKNMTKLYIQKIRQKLMTNLFNNILKSLSSIPEGDRIGAIGRTGRCRGRGWNSERSWRPER
jgi:hypothetical protein